MSRQSWRSRWWMPAFCLVLGALVGGAFLLGGSPGMALFGFGLMTGLGALALLARRSETIQGLSATSQA